MKTSATATTDHADVIARPPFIYAVALLAVLVLRWPWPMPLFTEFSALWPGLAMVALGVGIAIWGRRTMTAAGTNVDPMLPVTAIVTSGPFRFSRNPLYVSLTLVYVGLVLWLNTWWGIVILVPLLAIMHIRVVLEEERYLERKFGDEYRRYRSRVRRYF